MRAGVSVSCGCYNRDVIRKFGESVYKEKLYYVWHSMKQRCSNPNDKAYPNYGGRGIKVCTEWEHDYLAFKKWAMGNGYKPGLWIERVDNSKDYSPNNCRWETPKQQQRNKRTNVLVMIGGVEKCIAEWAELSGIPFATLERRIELGWPAEKLLSPVDKRYSHSEAIRKAINPRTEITITRIIDPVQDAQMSML